MSTDQAKAASPTSPPSTQPTPGVTPGAERASDSDSASAAPPWVASPFRSDLFTRTAAGQVPGHVAIVTGGGTGIGRAIALSLAGCGARLAICGRRPDPLHAVAAEISAHG